MNDTKYLKYFFKACIDNKIDIKYEPNINVDYALLKDLNDNIVKMDRNLNITKVVK